MSAENTEKSTRWFRNECLCHSQSINAERKSVEFGIPTHLEVKLFVTTTSIPYGCCWSNCTLTRHQRLVRKDDVDESMEESSRAPQTRTNHTKKPAKQLWLYNLLQSHSDWHTHKLVPLMIGSMLLLDFFLFSASDLIVSSRALQIASCSKNNNTFRKCNVVALFLFVWKGRT